MFSSNVTLHIQQNKHVLRIVRGERGSAAGQHVVNTDTYTIKWALYVILLQIVSYMKLSTLNICVVINTSSKIY